MKTACIVILLCAASWHDATSATVPIGDGTPRPSSAIPETTTSAPEVPTPPGAANTEQGNYRAADSPVFSECAGQPGVPGYNGSPGKDGRDGSPGLPGHNGEPGPAGNPGADGLAGRDGLPGLDGQPGDYGLQGEPGYRGDDGETGHPGPIGPEGAPGPIGFPGPFGAPGNDGAPGRDGRDGRDGHNGLSRWRQCAWTETSDIDNGVIKSCAITKSHRHTWLKVSFSGNLRVADCTKCCRRWFFTFNDRECVYPVPIDATISASTHASMVMANSTRPRHIEGYCGGNFGNFRTGTVVVKFNVGSCTGYGRADAVTGGGSSSRIIIEEVAPPVSDSETDDFPVLNSPLLG